MEEIEQKIKDLSVMEQSIQHSINQKKIFQNQLLEIESALSELGNEDSYKIIGNFMFKKNSEEQKKELEEKKELLKIRIKTYENQEEESDKKFKELQSSVLNELSKKEDKKVE